MSRSSTPIVEGDTKHPSTPGANGTPSEHEKAINDMFANASAATDKEHRMTLMEGLRLYPKAIGWSALISTLCAMEGYDVSLIGNFCTFPVHPSRQWHMRCTCSSCYRFAEDMLLICVDAFEPFSRKYGELTSTGTYEVSASWQAGLSNGAQVGQILGLLGEYQFFPLCRTCFASQNTHSIRSQWVCNGAVWISKSMPRVPSLASSGDDDLLYRPKRSSPSRSRDPGRNPLGCVPSQYVTNDTHLALG